MSATEKTLEVDDLNDLPFEQLLTRICGENLIQEAPIFQLPDSILVNILSLLKHEDILTSVRLVCRKWLVVGRDRYIWKHCDVFNRSQNNTISIEKFLACCRYAKGVQYLAFRSFLHEFGSDTFQERENLIACFKLLVLMPELKGCVTPIFFEEFQLKSFCDALGRYCPLVKNLYIRICDMHEVKLTSHSSCFNMLKRCERLAALTISLNIGNYGSCVAPSFVPVLADCIPNLEELYLDAPNVFEDGCFEALANSSIQLKKLYFVFRYPSTVNNVVCIPKLKSLKSLHISFYWHGGGDPGPPELITKLLKEITEDGGLCDLTDLAVEGESSEGSNYNVYDDSFYFLVTNLKKLTVMTLHWLHITDVSLQNVATHCTKLETLSLICCQDVTNSGILTIIEKLKALQNVKLYGTGTDDIVKSIQTTYLHIDLEAVGLHTLEDD